jgi:hypothetical protein
MVVIRIDKDKFDERVKEIMKKAIRRSFNLKAE